MYRQCSLQGFTSRFGMLQYSWFSLWPKQKIGDKIVSKTTWLQHFWLDQHHLPSLSFRWTFRLYVTLFYSTFLSLHSGLPTFYGYKPLHIGVSMYCSLYESSRVWSSIVYLPSWCYLERKLQHFYRYSMTTFPYKKGNYSLFAVLLQVVHFYSCTIVQQLDNFRKPKQDLLRMTEFLTQRFWSPLVLS